MANTSVWAQPEKDSQALQQFAMQPEPGPSVWAPVGDQPSTPDLSAVSRPVPNVQVFKPSPLQQQIANDQQRLQKVQFEQQNPWGTAQNHPGKLGKLAHVFSEIGNIAGDIFAPSTMALIPGTQLNREVQEGGLAKRLNMESQAESENEARGAQTAKTQEDTKLAPGEAQARENLEGAQASLVPSEIERNQAEIHGLENPWAKLPENQPLQNADQINKGMMDRYQVLHPGEKLPQEFSLPANATKGDFDRIDKLMTAEETAAGNQANREQSNKLREAMLSLAMQNAADKNLWSVPQPDGTSKVVSLRPGDTVPKGAVSLSGQSSQNAKAGGADVQASLSYANDYLQSGAFTGPGDEALQDQFFNLAKPSTGFRMNQAQIDQLHNMASWMDSWRGKAYHAMNGVWFAPEQRRQIVQTMNALATSKGIEPTGGQRGTAQPQPAGAQQTPQRPASVPEGYVFKDGPKGKGWYRP